MNSKIIYPVLSALAFVTIGAVIGSMTSPDIQSWYQRLERPFFNPPEFVFPVVWSLLYALLGIIFGRILVYDHTPRSRFIFIIFILQMFMNWAWSFLFFTLQMLLLSWLWILAMVVLSVFIFYDFLKSDRLNAMLFLPYLLWIGFACLLAFRIWQLN